MPKHPISILLLSTMFLCRCALEPAPPDLPTTEVKRIRLLLLIADKQLEVWTEADSLSFSQWTSFPLQVEADYPIGLFKILTGNNSLSIVFENDFYRKKEQSLHYPIVREKYSQLLSLLKRRDAEALWQISALAPEVNLLVVPNDTRNGGQFKPCRNCPSWMAELYSQLQLELMDFKN